MDNGFLNLAVLKDAVVKTFQNYPAVVKLFWPTWLILILGGLVSIMNFDESFTVDSKDSPILTGVLVIAVFLFAIYYVLLVCSGLIGWHRSLILDENPTWISLKPIRGAVLYASQALLFLIVVGIIWWPISSMLFGYVMNSMTPKFKALKLFYPIRSDQMQTWLDATAPVNFALMVVGVLCTFLWFNLAKQWLLIFPYNSVKKSSVKYGSLLNKFGHITGLVGPLTIISAIPPIIVLVHDHVVPYQFQRSIFVSFPYSILDSVIDIFGILIAASVLSLGYMRATKEAIKIN